MQYFSTRLLFVGLTSLLMLFTASEGRANSITIAWDANPEFEVVGYYVYIGTSPGAPTTIVDVGNTTSYIFPTADPNTTYYLTVAAYVPGPLLGPVARELVVGLSEAPTMTGPGDRASIVGAAVELMVTAADPNGDPLTLVAEGLPPGLALNSSSRAVAGTPTLAGIYPVSLTASDPSGNRITRSFTWTITTNDRSAPIVAVKGPTTATTYSTTSAFVTLTGTASDDVGVTTVAWSSNGAAGGSAAGTSDWSVIVPLTAGSNVIIVTAYDEAGRMATDSINVTYAVPAPVPPTPVPPTPAPPTNPPAPPLPPKTTKPSPAQVRTLTATLRAPQRMGRPITFNASATGGTGIYQYQWLIYDGRKWTVLQPWSPSSAFSWAPITDNSKYRMRVWVKNQGAAAASLSSPDDVKTIDFPITR